MLRDPCTRTPYATLSSPAFFRSGDFARGHGAHHHRVGHIASAGFTPAFQATIPEILPDEERYSKALALSRLAYDLESLLSPTLAAIRLWPSIDESGLSRQYTTT